MAYKPEKFCQLSGHTAGARQYAYVDDQHTLAEIAAVDFFLPIVGLLAVNDWVFITGNDGGGIARVNANTGTSIDLTDAVTVNADTG